MVRWLEPVVQESGVPLSSKLFTGELKCTDNGNDYFAMSFCVKNSKSVCGVINDCAISNPAVF